MSKTLNGSSCQHKQLPLRDNISISDSDSHRGVPTQNLSYVCPCSFCWLNQYHVGWEYVLKIGCSMYAISVTAKVGIIDVTYRVSRWRRAWSCSLKLFLELVFSGFFRFPPDHHVSWAFWSRTEDVLPVSPSLPCSPLLLLLSCKSLYLHCKTLSVQVYPLALEAGSWVPSSGYSNDLLLYSVPWELDQDWSWRGFSQRFRGECPVRPLYIKSCRKSLQAKSSTKVITDTMLSSTFTPCILTLSRCERRCKSVNLASVLYLKLCKLR